MRCYNCHRLVIPPNAVLDEVNQTTAFTVEFSCSCGARYSQTTQLLEVRPVKKQYEGEEDRRQSER